MKKASRYFIIRASIALAFGALFALPPSPWWMGLLSGGLVMVFFFGAPRSGFYTVHREGNTALLQRDERQQAITDKSAKNAFVAVMTAIAILALCFGLIIKADVPVHFLNKAIGLGWVVYFISSFRLRRIPRD
jgi:hypothetical protein